MDKNIFKAGVRVLLCFFVLANASVYAMENNNQTLNQKGIIGKALAVIATSSAIHCWNQFFAKMISLRGVLASEELQALGKEAQAAVGIPVCRHVPIQYVSELNASAIAEINAILVGNELNDDRVAYGVKRCNMFHEAVHIKYHDDAFNGFLLFCSFLGIPLATKMFIKPLGKLKLLYVPSLLAGYYVGRAIQRQFENYRERRADIEGHYATQCHKCVAEKTEDIRYAHELAHDIIVRLDRNPNLNEAQVYGLVCAKDWIEDRRRYLSVEENEIIAAELKRDYKICAFHEKSK
jgi:hypothetical protein